MPIGGVQARYTTTAATTKKTITTTNRTQTGGRSSSGSKSGLNSKTANSKNTQQEQQNVNTIETLTNTAISATELSTRRHGWQIQASKLAKNTHNRIRGIVESLKIKPHPDKPMIPLSIGDPTTFGNLRASDETMKAMLKSLESGKYNGYASTQGHEEARQAIAKYSAHQNPDAPINAKDVIICSGCSAALEYSILALADCGQNILVPRPGFCLYRTLCEGLDIEVRYYDLLPQKRWQANLTQLESLIDENTAALLINNPSNPCGSVFSKQHLLDMIAICEKYYLPIIADEIYEHFVFPGAKHVAISSLTNQVPVVSCGGLTKRFLVPGWRLGWIIIHDREQRLGDVVSGIYNMAGRILGSNTIVQGALPDILEKTPKTYFDIVIDILYNNAMLAYKMLKKVRGLNPVMPDGAMYMMVGVAIENFPEFKDDLHFVEELVKEQSVFCLPGSCFDIPNYMRIVLTVPGPMLEEACTRITEFCELHCKMDSTALIEHGLLDGAVSFLN